MVTCGIPEGHPMNTKLLSLLGATSNADLAAGQAAFLGQANYGSENTFKTTNLLLVDKDLAGADGVKESYQALVTAPFNAEARTADFHHKAEEEKKKIRATVNEVTDGFMPDYESIADSSTDVDLMNITYFKGKWQYPFEVKNTKDRRECSFL